jgi:hypothetical protein
MKIRQISKSLLGMSIKTRIIRLVKKTGVKKSRWTVPLSDLETGLKLKYLEKKRQRSLLSKKYLQEKNYFDVVFTRYPLDPSFLMKIGIIVGGTLGPAFYGPVKLHILCIVLMGLEILRIGEVFL